MKKLKDRFDALSNGKKLAVLFVIYWIYWFAAMWLFELVWTSETPKTMGERIFHATWMASFWPMVFNWKLVKSIFNGRKHG